MELRNRIAVSAMGVSLSEDDGGVGERLIALSRGAGGRRRGADHFGGGRGGLAGRRGGAGADGNFGRSLHSGLRALTERVHRHGAKIATQLHMGGLVAGYSFNRWGHPLAPAIPPSPKGSIAEFFTTDERWPAW